MKPMHKTLFVGLALAALVTAPLAFTAVQGPPPKPEGKPEGRPQREHHDEGGLEGSMQALNGGMKRLAKAMDKPDLEAVAKAAVDMQRAVLAAKVETPATANEISDPKEKAAFVLGFRKEMNTLQRVLLDLESAALDGKTDDAKKIFNDTLGSLKKAGHDKYKKD